MGLGRIPNRQVISCIFESKSAALVAADFVDFPTNRCNFRHENDLDIVRRYRLYNRLPVQTKKKMYPRSYSPGAVATIALWKSAPMSVCAIYMHCLVGAAAFELILWRA